MDKKRSLLNVIVSIVFKIVLVFAALLNRRFLIQYGGNDVNGLNSFYASFISFLSVAELGIGTAITYCMYKPICSGDSKKVSALYILFKKMYMFVGFFLLIAGVVSLFFLPYLIADYSSFGKMASICFVLSLVSSVLTYFYSAKTSLINAYKNNWITTLITSSCILLKDVIQIIIIVITKKFIFYISVAIFTTIVEWIVTCLVTRKMHSEILSQKSKLDLEDRKEVSKNIKALFAHKIGSVLVNAIDNIIISAFLGSLILGKYSNYTTIMASMVGVISLFFTPLTSVIGHLVAEKDKTEVYSYFQYFFDLNFVLSIIFFIGYYFVINDLISICFGTDLNVSNWIVLIIVINNYTQFMRQNILLFRNATGVFYNDRFKPLIEGAVNLLLSIVFVMIFPDEFKVVGVIVATIITNLSVCFTIEPYMLFKHYFNIKVTGYYFKNYMRFVVFSLLLFLLTFAKIQLSNHIVSFLINGFLAVGIAALFILLNSLLDKAFRNSLKSYVEIIKKGRKHEKKS